MMRSKKVTLAVIAGLLVGMLFSLAALGAWWERNYFVPPGIVRSGSLGSISGGRVNRVTNTYSGLGNALAPYSGKSHAAAWSAGRDFQRTTRLSRGALHNMSYTDWATRMGTISGSI